MYSINSWRHSANRECVASKIEDAIVASNILTRRNGMELEKIIFQQAKDKGEYCMFIGIVIRKINERGIEWYNFGGPSYDDEEQPIVDPLAEIPGLTDQGPSGFALRKGRIGLGALDDMPEVTVPSLRSGSMLTPGGRSLQSEKYKGEYSWKTPAFRKSIVEKFNEAMDRYGQPTSKNSLEMEQLLFEKAKSREEYSHFAGRVLLHIREMGAARHDDTSPVSDIRDLIPDPLGDYMAKKGHPRRVHYPPYNYSRLRGTPKKLLGGG